MLFWLMRHHGRYRLDWQQQAKQQQAKWQRNESSKQVDAIDATNGVDDGIKHGLDRFDRINKVLMELMDLVNK